MNISSRCEYGCRAIVELALHVSSETPLTSEAIAEARRIPEKFLVHILLQLKRAGLVRSIRGARGGYMLAKAPDEISLLDIVEAIDGPVLHPLPLSDSESPNMAAAWADIARDVEGILRRTTIRHVIDRAAGAKMYYI